MSQTDLTELKTLIKKEVDEITNTITKASDDSIKETQAKQKKEWASILELLDKPDENQSIDLDSIQTTLITKLLTDPIDRLEDEIKRYSTFKDKAQYETTRYTIDSFIPKVFKDIARKQTSLSSLNRTAVLDDETGYVRLNENHEIETILFEKELGKGSEGSVQQAVLITAQKTDRFALKLPKFYGTPLDMSSDASTLKTIKDAIKRAPLKEGNAFEQTPHVANLSEMIECSFKDITDSSTYTTKTIKMPFMEGGDALNKTKARKTEKVAPDIVFQELLSVSKEANFLMNRGLFHLDLKLANFVHQSTTDDGKLHLIDFSNFPTFDTRKNWKGGSPYTHLAKDFQALEVAEDSTVFQDLAEKCAVFQMGIALYQSLGGEIPDFMKSLSHNKTGEPPTPIDTIRTNIETKFWETEGTSTISLEGFTKEEALKSLLLSMLDSAPSKRPTMDDVITRLEELSKQQE